MPHALAQQVGTIPGDLLDVTALATILLKAKLEKKKKGGNACATDGCVRSVRHDKLTSLFLPCHAGYR